MGGRALFIMLSALAIILATLACLFWSQASFGQQTIDVQINYGRFALIAGATYLGVISNSLYDRLATGKDGQIFTRNNILFAAVVAPVVVLPIYKSLGDTPDPFIVALTAYQNGFFFNVFFDKIKKASPAAEKPV